MKKILSSFAIISLMLAANGCFWNSEDTVVEEPTYANYTGTLKSLGSIKVGKMATHMIQTEDGDVVYVYSSKHDLNDSEYINKEVEVYGEVYISEDDGIEILKITTIELAPEQEEVATASEQTYSDQEVGFSWNIMSDWTIERDSGYVIFTLPAKEQSSGTGTTVTSDYISVKVFDNTENLSLTDWLGTYDPTAVSMTSQGLINGSLEALGFTTEMQDVMTYFVKRTEGSVYEISHYNFDIANRTYFRNLFMDALQTFTFIPFGTGYEVIDIGGTSVGEETDDTPLGLDPVDSTGGNYDQVVSGVSEQITEIAPEEEAVGGTWYVTKYEFADPNYVYVEYEDGHDMRKVLLTYSLDGGFSYEVLAYFYPGEYTTWDVETGTDEAKGLQKTVVKPTDNGATVVASLLEGYSYLESSSKNFSIQYPSNWYYAASGNHYGFTSTSDGEELVGLDILDESFDDQSGDPMFTLANGKSAKDLTTDESRGIYIERDDNSCFYIYGAIEYSVIIENMAGSIIISE
ncbi:MAG: hypothetical protein ACD_51C00051G0002 [uncultured bacterium]|nr:MAG: hypothetical protein ACD_51C00051G0002 [uncultured bacterium]OGJ46887.1 MAG: hypothetical protein A2244_03050 [Candidatus Peregrinibacteria bacterium RIFOXYA2_FULL_41_18]OGJ49289.1 MAG: hypothetical protein A2344_00060 [Candidatus Peregrinibacteria bacterium RIFOXYB12_FULL_41_12]